MLNICENGNDRYYFLDSNNNIMYTSLDTFLKYKNKKITIGELLNKSKMKLSKAI